MFMEWMLLPLKRYADFSGRSRRKEYWMFALGLFILYVVVFGIGAMLGGRGADGAPSMLPSVLFLIVALALLLPSLAVQVRRFHDQDKSGWMVLLGLIPFVGGLIVLVFMCLPGTVGPNSYGPDPLDPNGDANLGEVFS
jgi:uncharacterized membrane protein YhaH (DUF805 family)